MDQCLYSPKSSHPTAGSVGYIVAVFEMVLALAGDYSVNAEVIRQILCRLAAAQAEQPRHKRFDLFSLFWF